MDRTGFLKKWMQRVKQLQRDDYALHRSLPDHLQKVLEGKRLLLWKEILTELEYPDAKIIAAIINGFPMTGWVEESGVPLQDRRSRMLLNCTKRDTLCQQRVQPRIQKLALKLSNSAFEMPSNTSKKKLASVLGVVS